MTRPEWKGPRVQVHVKLTPEGKRMLRALVRRRKMPQGEVVEELVRAAYEELGRRG